MPREQIAGIWLFSLSLELLSLAAIKEKTNGNVHYQPHGNKVNASDLISLIMIIPCQQIHIVHKGVFSGYSLIRASLCFFSTSAKEEKNARYKVFLLLSHPLHTRQNKRYKAGFFLFISFLFYNEKKQTAFHFQILFYMLIYLKILVHILGINLKRDLQRHVVIQTNIWQEDHLLIS